MLTQHTPHSRSSAGSLSSQRAEEMKPLDISVWQANTHKTHPVGDNSHSTVQPRLVLTHSQAFVNVLFEIRSLINANNVSTTLKGPLF